jgi:hypothetical protein
VDQGVHQKDRAPGGQRVKGNAGEDDVGFQKEAEVGQRRGDDWERLFPWNLAP